MVHTLACVVAGIVEMGTIALVSAFTVMIDNDQNKVINPHAIMENQLIFLYSPPEILFYRHCGCIKIFKIYRLFYTDIHWGYWPG